MDTRAGRQWLGDQGVRFTPGGVRAGAAGHRVCFIHPKGNEAAPNVQTDVTDALEIPSVIRLTIVETSREIKTNLEQTILFGRRDPSTDTYPEVDLTHDRGGENGVSRRHARLTKHADRILLEDIGSINGTFVNGNRLAAYLPQVVQYGDQIALGKLVIKVEFG